jgi:hypothetical protein
MNTRTSLIATLFAVILIPFVVAQTLRGPVTTTTTTRNLLTNNSVSELRTFLGVGGTNQAFYGISNVGQFVTYNPEAHPSSISIGLSSKAAKSNAVAIGYNTHATNFIESFLYQVGLTAVGSQSRAGGPGNTVVGYGSFTYTNQYATAVGIGSVAMGNFSAAFGASAAAGLNNSPMISNATAIGIAAWSTNTDSTAVGYYARTTGTNQVMLGGQPGGTGSYADVIIPGRAILSQAGSGLMVKEGANATSGAAVLVAGTVTVNTTKVTATSRIHLTSNVDGGTPGWVRVSGRVAGTSFTITSSDALDTSTIAWFIIEPAP